jgi:hypothetical protein
MRSGSPAGTLLVWVSRPGSAFQTVAIIGTLVIGVRWLLGRTSVAGALESALFMLLLWLIGSWLRRLF